MTALATTTRLPRTIIPARVDHRAFIEDSWISCDAKAPGGWRSRKLTISAAKAIVRGIIETAGVHTMVAVLPDDDSAILGWACYELGMAPTVHYVFSREKLGAHRQGIATELLRPFRRLDGVEYTHRPANTNIPIPESWGYVSE